MRDLEAEISRAMKAVERFPLVHRVEFWSGYFLGAPYIENPLDDANMRIRFDGFDCMTFVETCIALGYSRKFEEILPNLDRIRYGNRKPSFGARRHFVSADWIPGNEGILRPMDIIADTVCEKEIDRVYFFRKKHKPFPRGHKLEPLELARLRYVSIEQFPGIVPALPRISVVLFVGSIDWTIVSHMGFAINDGGVVFRHASSRHRVVLDVDAMEYFSTRPSLDGAAFLELL